MNTKQKYILIIAVVIIVVLFVVWLLSGSEMLTKTQVLVDKTTELDKMLGVKNEVWEDKFVFGLLPGGISLTSASVSVSTIAAVIVFISGILFFLIKNKKTKEIK